MRLPALKRRSDGTATSEPPLDPTSWTGALILMGIVTAVLWAIQIANASDDYGFNRFGLTPRAVHGLWGIGTEPFLHQSYAHLAANTLPLVAIGWVLLLSGWRVFAFVTAVVVLLGGAATWLVAPSDHTIVGASGMIFGWAGYLLARAFFSRRIKWIIVAVLLLLFFGTLSGGLLPSSDARVSWQSHVCGALAGVLVGWFLHPRKPARPGRPGRTRRAPVR